MEEKEGESIIRDLKPIVSTKVLVTFAQVAITLNLTPMVDKANSTIYAQLYTIRTPYFR